MKYKAVMFDIDGTLTELGERVIPDFLVAKLNELTRSGVSCAVCSGRHHSESILDRLKVDSPEKWVLITENGAAGYSFKNGSWNEFYRIPWPSGTILKDELADILQKRMTFSRFFNNLSTIIFRPDVPLEASATEVATKCDEYDSIVKKIFKEMNITGLHISNSRIGIIIGPENGDKDAGVLEFAKFLGISDTKEIVCIGDQPNKGYNDHYFLNGKYGTPFTVKGPKDTLKVLEDL